MIGRYILGVKRLQRSDLSYLRRLSNSQFNTPPPPTYFANDLHPKASKPPSGTTGSVYKGFERKGPEFSSDRTLANPSPSVLNTFGTPAAPTSTTPFAPSSDNSSAGNIKPRELFTLVFFVAALSGLYIEYERQSKEFERRLTDQQTTYQKNLIQNFNKYQQHKKQRDMLFMKKDKEHMKLEMKLSIHVGLLRKQLQEAGIDPVSIEKAIEQYERDVKIGSTLTNGSLLWVDDASTVRPFVPHFKDYEKKGPNH
ncbi:hypothetical protein BABINDRAFT_79764 [Babjeviella inositovora NRRL Y-12698]|uniref:Uncharacterized protein n=1 Tax=Babjeviella inositovora NRRL Y-12698 TaxID=984486 RepID=A0A1E3QZH6_9ASCO|nr:uncharacterized protein BABINDRAFT_79764 [Babjeviella inositovora NRRL Y-12698]ODQ83025.1 hypothetical protein BABINDRAFT_79764 [Babjeviella inositovora NRRL Y-12698]